jgi:hypothetical protein
MANNQDWCLECGTAAPGRLGTRPGLRAAVTVAIATLLLAGGAVAASYAALSGDANRTAAAAAPPSVAPVAVAPPATPPAPTPTAPPATGVPGVVPGATAPPTVLPKITLPPVIPPHVNPVPPVAVTPVTPPAVTPKPKPAGPTRYTLGADALGLYDPYGAATDKGDPADAYDKDLKTSWFVTSKNAQNMSVGLVIDLEKARSVKTIELATPTPGYRVEVYATDSDELPPDILDSRWNHVRDRSRVDETTRDGSKKGDGGERIALRDGAGTYRYLVLWFTAPPKAGPTVRITELAIVG